MSAQWACAPLVLTACLVLSVSQGCGSSTTVAESAADGGLVVVQVPAGALDTERASFVDPDSRFPTGSRVAVVNLPGKPAATHVLSDGLLAAGAPAVSPDGRRLLFAARAEPAGPWAIYEAPLGRGRRRVVARREDSCTDPAYVAGERFVMSCRDLDPSGKPLWSLYTASLRGSDPRRITFGPRDAFRPTVLADGRVLFSMRQAGGPGRPGEGTVALFTVNPDGTLLDAFAGSHDATAKFGARQVDGDTVILLERTADGTGPRLRRIDFQRAHRASTPLLPAPDDGGAVLNVESVEPTPDGELLVAVRRGAGDFAIQRLSPGRVRLEDIFDEPGWDDIAAVPILRREPPRGRPSPIDRSTAFGTLVGYDSARSDHVVGPAREAPVPVRLTVETATGDGRARSLGELSVAADGSFFVEVPADTPLRVVTFDDGGRTIATSGWFWVRPGERRACFGCHEPRNSAPLNRTVAALAGDPARLPAAIGAAP